MCQMTAGAEPTTDNVAVAQQPDTGLLHNLPIRAANAGRAVWLNAEAAPAIRLTDAFEAAAQHDPLPSPLPKDPASHTNIFERWGSTQL